MRWSGVAFRKKWARKRLFFSQTSHYIFTCEFPKNNVRNRNKARNFQSLNVMRDNINTHVTLRHSTRVRITITNCQVQRETTEHIYSFEVFYDVLKTFFFLFRALFSAVIFYDYKTRFHQARERTTCFFYTFMHLFSLISDKLIYFRKHCKIFHWYGPKACREYRLSTGLIRKIWRSKNSIVRV